jgi:oxygen-independent coproporphyrinogen-3 oxidase
VNAAKQSATSAAIDATRPLGVYVHFPFCSTRCPYCDFAVAVRRNIPHETYADAVLAELRARGSSFRGNRDPRLASIYFGGGTPGLWHPDALGRVLAGVRTMFDGAADLEITIEANPGDLDATGLARLRSHGANRLSFGAQAFQDRLLHRLGRKHDSAAVGKAMEAARRAGFENLCADLMFGLPGQSMEDWQASLAALLALRPQHITAYALTVEEDTRFGALDRAGKLPRPDDGEAADMYSACHDYLTGEGYEHYEISSYALPGWRSRHNSLYWTMGAYLGLGVSAASFLPLASGDGYRHTNPRTLPAYLKQVAAGKPATALDEADRVPARQLEEEALWLALRTSDGVDRRTHERRHGHDPLVPSGRQVAARTCVEAGWLEVTPRRLRLLPAGFLFADEVAVRLWDAERAQKAK